MPALEMSGHNKLIKEQLIRCVSGRRLRCSIGTAAEAKRGLGAWNTDHHDRKMQLSRQELSLPVFSERRSGSHDTNAKHRLSLSIAAANAAKALRHVEILER